MKAEQERRKAMAARQTVVSAAREAGFLKTQEEIDEMEEEFGKAVRSLHEIDTDTVRQWLESRRDDLQNGLVQLDTDIARLTAKRENKLEALDAVNAGLEKLGSASGRSPDEIEADVRARTIVVRALPPELREAVIADAKDELERDIPDWKSKPLDPTDEFYANDGDKPALLKHKHILPGSSEKPVLP